MVKKFMRLNFVTNEVLRKFFNTEFFPIYGITKSIMVNGSVKFPYVVSKMIVQSSIALVVTPLKDISKRDTLFSIIHAWHYNIGKNFESCNFKVKQTLL